MDPAGLARRADPAEHETPIFDRLVAEWRQRGRALPGPQAEPPQVRRIVWWD